MPEVVRKRDPGPAVEHGFTDGGNRAGVVNICPKIAACVDATEHPAGVRDDAKKAQARAISGCAMHRKQLLEEELAAS